MEFFSPWTQQWIVVPLMIFVARMLDVGIGTFRIIMISRGKRLIAPALGFIEILIWLLAIRQIFQHLDNPVAFVAYALGFAAGTHFGMALESRLAMGLVSLRVITSEDARDLVSRLSESDFGVTSFAAEGVAGRVRLHFTILPRRKLTDALAIIAETHPTAFISVADVRSAREGVFPEEKRLIGFGKFRKGK